MNELLFVGMDIVKEVENIVGTTMSACTNGMTEHELAAYKCGVLNTVSILRGIIDSVDGDRDVVVNINELDMQQEFDFEDLINYLDTRE